MKALDNLARFGDRIVGKDRANYPSHVNVSQPNRETIDFIRGTQCRAIAELGIYQGHTSMEFAKYLNGQGQLDLFDFSDRVEAVAAELAEAGYTNVKTYGCSYKLLDSYNWPLAKLLEADPTPRYDYVFLDGAHTWAIDALSVFLADKLLKVGGYFDFDDYEWTLAGSPSLNPRAFPLTAKLYPPEQIESQQVKMLLDIILRRDPRYKEVLPNKIFQKIA